MTKEIEIRIFSKEKQNASLYTNGDEKVNKKSKFLAISNLYVFQFRRCSKAIS